MGETKREIGEKNIQGVTGVTEVTIVEYDIFWLWLPKLLRLLLVFIAKYLCFGHILILGYNLAISFAFISIFKPSTAIDLNHILIFHFF